VSALGQFEITQDLLLAQDGDREALLRFLASVEPHVRRYCAWMLRRPDLIDDLAQETLLRVLRGLDSFRGDSGGVAWTLAIARRVCLDNGRNEFRHERRVEAVKANLKTVNIGSSPGDVIELMDLVSRLPEEQREAFVLVKVFGFSYIEVANMLSCPIGTIQSRVSRSRVALIELLEVDYPSTSPESNRPRRLAG